LSKRVPAPLVALLLAGLAAHFAARWWPGFSVVTIDDRFTYLFDGAVRPGIPELPPTPLLPWRLPGGGGEPLVLSFDLIRALLPAAFTIAILGAIESLLSAVVADGMTGKKHDPDSELLAQGIGNFVAPFFGGFAATGAIARTATNVRAGARIAARLGFPRPVRPGSGDRLRTLDGAPADGGARGPAAPRRGAHGRRQAHPAHPQGRAAQRHRSCSSPASASRCSSTWWSR
jgi:hypothetical protein